MIILAQLLIYLSEICTAITVHKRKEGKELYIVVFLYQTGNVNKFEAASDKLKCVWLP